LPGRRVVIADTGYSLITAEWVPDPGMEAQALLRLSDAIEDWRSPMEEVRTITRQSIRRRFDTETDPEGKPWEALSEGYLSRKRREGYPDRILRRDEALYEAATDEGSFMITEREVIFEPDRLPFYGGLHQAGMPSTTYPGRTNNPLPQRAFIGLTDDDIDEIEAEFVFWLNRTVDTYYPSDVGAWRSYLRGDVVATTRGATGYFTGIAAFGGGTLVRGNQGRYIGVTYQTGSHF